MLVAQRHSLAISLLTLRWPFGPEKLFEPCDKNNAPHNLVEGLLQACQQQLRNSYSTFATKKQLDGWPRDGKYFVISFNMEDERVTPNSSCSEPTFCQCVHRNRKTVPKLAPSKAPAIRIGPKMRQEHGRRCHHQSMQSSF